MKEGTVLASSTRQTIVGVFPRLEHQPACSARWIFELPCRR
jgi:hypothetical protein